MNRLPDSPAQTQKLGTNTPVGRGQIDLSAPKVETSGISNQRPPTYSPGTPLQQPPNIEHQRQLPRITPINSDHQAC
ncbi:uncharacterized protein BDZ83DRAFT_249698 [Colletotrichum acutatum]|uniref:Uncharacterized protein n=1 Tax=Glomerella acutata TaxID=27357 RepID=A0AAD8XG46_GLOAC|nr:uncharacterized protein BDZ83DRAFT_249698 [Colletotrichum acutatum]KAK1726674.1 hypothetical protein BDZ83DRAFT_249698 [Colletotrichum acutatum]